MEINPRLYIRHGQSTHNILPESVLDQGDPPLTPAGIRQAHDVGRFLLGYGLDIIICSPAIRASGTAEVISDYAGVQVVPDHRLREIDWGEWAGQRREAVFTPQEQERADNEGLSYRANPSAETMLEVHGRVRDVVRETSGLHTAFITHNFTIKSYIAGEFDWSRADVRKLKIANGEVLEAHPDSSEIPVTSIYVPARARLMTPARRYDHDRGRSNGQSRAITYDGCVPAARQ